MLKLKSNCTGGETRTPSLWFWRPLLCQLSYTRLLYFQRNLIPYLSSQTGNGAKAQRSPVPLRKQEVNRLLGKMDDVEENVDQLETLFSFGEQVKVVDGPFSNFTGSIEEINEEKHKLRVLVKIFGRSTPIELNFYQVEKLR